MGTENEGTQISVKFKNSITGQKKIKEYSEQLQIIKATLDGMEQGKMASIENALKKVSKNASVTNKSTKNLSKLFDFGIGLGKLTILAKTIVALTKNMMNLVKVSASYVENLNLLEVAYANINRETGKFNESIESSSKRIETYIDKMAEVYGFDENRLTRQFGIFKQLANAMELPAETGEQLSEIMVKMTNDIASLYNLPLERASNALQSALVGQVRPIRGATGADITENTLQKTVDTLGLDRTISQLSFTEKRLVMIISLTEQLKNSQGDYARTIESVSNQVKVMQEQWERLSRAVGNVFYPIIKKIMPYINGILMALTEIFQLIATLMGFTMPEFDYDSLAGVSEAALDIEDELNGAGDAADNLSNKLKGLRSFDKLNVINTPSDKSSSSSGGIGYIDPKIMNAFNKAFSEYDDKLDSVRMKATKIRDSIMEWLGFEKIINPLTGKTEWKYKGIGKTVENLVKWFKELSPLAKLVASSFAIMFGFKIIDGAEALIKLLKSTNGIKSWYGNLSKIDAFKIAIVGVTVGLIGLKSAIDDINKDGLNLGNFAKAEASIASMSVSLGILGSKISALGQYGGPIGVLIGSLIGLATAVVDGFKIIDAAHKSTSEAGKKYNEELAKSIEYAKDTADSGLVIIERNEQLIDELDDLVDANGRVKEGYEERVAFILNQLNSAFGTEYSLIDGVIAKNGEVIQSYEEVKQSIEDMIRQKKIEILLKAYEDEYVQALKTKKKAQDELNERQARYNYMLELTQKDLKGTAKMYNISTNDLIASLNRQKEGIDDLEKVIASADEEILKYEDLIKASTENNTEEMNKMLKEYGVTVEEENEKITTSTEKTNEKTKTIFSKTYDFLKNITGDTLSNLMTQFNGLDFSNTENKLLKPFEDAFRKTNITANEEMDTLTNNINQKTQNINPNVTVTIDADTNKFNEKVKSLSIGNLKIGASLFGFAGGGLPSVGQVFVANENGPELVDQIGGQSFVANQKQIGEYMDKRYGSYQQPINVTIPVEVGGEHLTTIVLNDLQNLAKTNGSAITIGG